MRKNSILAICLVSVVLVITSGCQSRSYVAEKQVLELAQKYTQYMADEKYIEIMNDCTGTLLQSLSGALPMLQATAPSQESKILNWQGKVDYMNKERTEASVIGTYTQQQTIKDFGTFTVNFTMVYDLVKLGGTWKLYYTSIAEKVMVQ